jgi:hypothetical protein
LRGFIRYRALPRPTELRLFCTSTTKYSIASAIELSRSSEEVTANTEIWRVYSELVGVS